MGYKQSSSGLPFKEIGSSPAKQNDLSKMPKDFNIKGSSASTTPKYNMKGTGNFNFTGSKASKTPGFSTTKIGKTLGKAGKLLGGKLAGTLGLLGAGTLSATATPTDKQGKKGSYTDDFTKLKQQLDNGKRVK